MENLIDKSKFVKLGSSKREEFYILFNKSGFPTQVKKIAKDKNILLIQKDVRIM